VKINLAILLLAALALTIGCAKKQEPPAPEIKIAADLSTTEITYLELILKDRPVATQAKIVFQPTRGLEAKNIMIGKDQPDIVELDYKDRLSLMNSCSELHKFFSDESQRSIFCLSHFAPGVFENRKYFFMPFRLDWPVFFFNNQKISGAPNNFRVVAGLCQGQPGAMGIAASGDRSLLEFMLSLVWAFRGNEFELEDPGTKEALEFLSSIRACVSPLSQNYDEQSLADGLLHEEISFAFAGFDAARRLWSNEAFSRDISSAPMPGIAPVAFSGSYLGVNRESKTPNAAFQVAFYLTRPETCGKIINSGLWLCAPPNFSAEPPPGRSDLFAPFLATGARLKPAPAGVDFGKLAAIYREIFFLIVFKGEAPAMVQADLRLKLKNLEQGL
jgi:hypothetical protein